MPRRKKKSSEDVEAGVIGSILLEPVKSMFVCHQSRMSEDWFENPKLRRIWSAVSSFSDKHGSNKIDLLSVTNWMQQDGTLDDIGGQDTLIQLIDHTPTAAHCEYYISVMKDGFVQRSSHIMLQEALLKIEDAQPPAEVLDNIVRNMTKMGTHGCCNQTPAEVHEGVLNEWMMAKENGFVGLPCSIFPLQQILGSYVAPDNIVVAARPSCGKTALVLQDCAYIAEEKGAPVGVISLEMRESQLRARLAGSYAGVNTFKMRNGMGTPEEFEKMREAFNHIEKLPIHIFDGRMSISEIKSCAVNMKARFGIELLMIDYLQLIRRSKVDGNRMDVQVVGEWSAMIKEMGQQLDMATVLLSQLSRGPERSPEKTPAPPTLESLRSSGEIEQNADVVVLLYKYPGLPMSEFNGGADWPMQANVAKNRNGPTGATDITFVRKNQRFVPTIQIEDEKWEESKSQAWRA